MRTAEHGRKKQDGKVRACMCMPVWVCVVACVCVIVSARTVRVHEREQE